MIHGGEVSNVIPDQVDPQISPDLPRSRPGGEGAETSARPRLTPAHLGSISTRGGAPAVIRPQHQYAAISDRGARSPSRLLSRLPRGYLGYLGCLLRHQQPVPCLPRSPKISQDLPRPPKISQDLPRSPQISPDLPRSPPVSTRWRCRARCATSTRQSARPCTGARSSRARVRPAHQQLAATGPDGAVGAYARSSRACVPPSGRVPRSRPFLDLSWSLPGPLLEPSCRRVPRSSSRAPTPRLTTTRRRPAPQPKPWPKPRPKPGLCPSPNPRPSQPQTLPHPEPFPTPNRDPTTLRQPRGAGRRGGGPLLDLS